MVRDPASQLFANLFLGHRGPVLHCLSVNHMDRISHAAEGIDTRGDIVGNDPVAAFPRSFCPSFFNHGPGLGGEAGRPRRGGCHPLG